MKITGTHAIRQVLTEAIYSSIRATLYISKQHNKLKEFLQLIEQSDGIDIVYKNNSELKKLGTKQQVLLVIHSDTENVSATSILDLKHWLKEHESKENLCILILDHLQDAQNVGAIFRSAALFGIDCIISARQRSAPKNEYAMKAASGGMSIVPSCNVSNIANSIRLLKEYNIWTYALHMQGKNIKKYTLPSRVAFVLGSEHDGVSLNVLQNCDDALSIATKKLQTLDSLNVSVSAAIACYEYYNR